MSASFSHRRTVVLENGRVALTFLPGGGHIAALTLKSNNVNALWDPPWNTIDPAGYDPQKHPDYGEGPEAKLLAGIAGHNLCFDFFGPPSEAEIAAGHTVHGEASVVNWEVESKPGELIAAAELPLARMRIERRLRLGSGAQAVVVTESAENLNAVDRAVGWQQHVTLGPPFLEKGKTVFHLPATSCKVYEQEFAPGGHDRFVRGAEFTWPMAPGAGGGWSDMRVTVDKPVSGALTAQLMNPALDQAFFTAFHPGTKTVFGYVWKRADFPWLTVWEENHARDFKPWNGQTFTRGMEFGVSPFAEARPDMVARGRMFGEKCYRFIPARSKVTVEYVLFIGESERPVEAVEWSGDRIRGAGGFEAGVSS